MRDEIITSGINVRVTLKNTSEFEYRREAEIRIHGEYVEMDILSWRHNAPVVIHKEKIPIYVLFNYSILFSTAFQFLTEVIKEKADADTK